MSSWPVGRINTSDSNTFTDRTQTDTPFAVGRTLGHTTTARATRGFVSFASFASFADVRRHPRPCPVCWRERNQCLSLECVLTSC